MKLHIGIHGAVVRLEVGGSGAGRRREEQAEALGTCWSRSSEGPQGRAEHEEAAYELDREAVFFSFSSYRFD